MKFDNLYKKFLSESCCCGSKKTNIIRDDDTDPVEDNATIITFKTTDPTIIDVFKSGFASAKFEVNVKDEEDDEKTNTVDVDGTLFTDIDVCECDADDETCPECGNNPCTCDDEACPECGNNPCTCDDDDEESEAEEDDEDDNDEDDEDEDDK